MDLIEFAEKVHGVHLYEYQKEILRKIEAGGQLIVWPRCTGKTTLLQAIEKYREFQRLTKEK